MISPTTTVASVQWMGGGVKIKFSKNDVSTS